MLRLEAAGPDAGSLHTVLEEVGVRALDNVLVRLIHSVNHDSVVISFCDLEQVEIWEFGAALRYVDECAYVPGLSVDHMDAVGLAGKHD